MILTVNAGSSSLKVGLFQPDETELPVVSATIERLDGHGGTWKLVSNGEHRDGSDVHSTHESALIELLAWLEAHGYQERIKAVGHRVVHGGPTYFEPAPVDDTLLGDLDRFIPMDPGHLPPSIACIRTVRRSLPNLPQIACFDTAFHHTMPSVAKLTTFPRRLESLGVRRYGFHGISYQFILRELEARDSNARQKRTIIAHLGNGASMVAIEDGRSVDTTMGMTPTGGLMMGTRSGDVDPGTLVFLVRTLALDADGLASLVNKESGLLGVSGLASDMRDVLAAADSGDEWAREAVDLYCFRARKYIGALTAVLGGLDRLVFTGGIGEHSAPIRGGIGTGLEYLGISINTNRNNAHADVISPDTSPVEVMVIPTNEDLMIAHLVADTIRTRGLFPRREGATPDVDSLPLRSGDFQCGSI